MDERSPEFLDAYTKEIARVIIASAYLDDELCGLITATLDLNDIQANALVRPMQARAKLDLMERLVNTFVKDKKDAAVVTKFIRECKSAFLDRNEVAHGLFGHNSDGEVTVRSYSGKAKLTGQPKRWTIQQVGELADKLLALEEACATMKKALASA